MYYTAPNRSSLHVCANCEHFIRLVFLQDEGEGPYYYGVCGKYPRPDINALSGCFAYDTCEGFGRKTELDWMPLFIEEYYELAQERRAEEQSGTPAKTRRKRAPREKKERGQGDGS